LDAGDVLVFATAMNMLNTPFNDSFMVNTLWEVRPTSPTTCTAAIHLKVTQPFWLHCCRYSIGPTAQAGSVPAMY
jgi:hypothetical protein